MVILSGSEVLERRGNVTIAELTRVVRSVPCEIPLSSPDGMPVDCVINTDNLHTIPRDRLRQRITHLSGENLFRSDQAIRYSLGLE